MNNDDISKSNNESSKARQPSSLYRRSLILAQSAESGQSAQFYFLKADFNLKSNSEKMCKKNFYTFLHP